ncbi:putative porin signal peptide protein [Thioalkalivibrio nitratireducens DSM 14787]|uniref:Porin signal peptide protein n=1 Tax=Thioalkalivibrio nitratireducens (strain DSM 14787 / UNIQEM 213 / ALEN2) TaxID=1255043 RepID=L0DWD7_THIND|nr:porin [Thioalkalivibrio nitratireducens]AGA32681.1 putative porin signal peptide protein [Thioalkalivibrio nitratireducens DSM 14787]
MNKKLLAVAVAAFVAAPAIATADTTLFGQVKYEVGAIEDGNDRNLVHSTEGTRLGVRGAEDLGGGMQGIFRLQGNFGGKNTSFANQNYSMNEEAWVGLQGDFGRVLLGRSDSAMKLASLPFRAFTDTLADLNNRPFSWGRAEGVHYTTPSFNGLTVSATVEPMGVKAKSYYALNAIYKQGPIFVSAAVEDANSLGLFQGGGKQIVPGNTNWQIGGSYDFGAGTVGLLYQDIDDIADVVTLPVTFKVTPQVSLRAAVQYRDFDNGPVDDLTNFAVGASYHFSNRTEVFANVWYDDEVSSTFGGAEEETQLGIGLRHSF